MIIRKSEQAKKQLTKYNKNRATKETLSKGRSFTKRRDRKVRHWTKMSF